MIAATPIRPSGGAGTITDRVFFNAYITPQIASAVAWRRAEMGAVERRRSAGGRLRSRAGADRALEKQADGHDLVCGYPLRHRVAFWGGSGGSVVVNDLDERMTIALRAGPARRARRHRSARHDVIEPAYDALAVSRPRARAAR